MAGQPDASGRGRLPLLRGGHREGRGRRRNARSLAVNEGGAIKSRACVCACVQCAVEGRRSSRCVALLRLSGGKERREERAQINLLSGAGGRGRKARWRRTGWPTGGPGRRRRRRRRRSSLAEKEVSLSHTERVTHSLTLGRERGEREREREGLL